MAGILTAQPVKPPETPPKPTQSTIPIATGSSPFQGVHSAPVAIPTGYQQLNPGGAVHIPTPSNITPSYTPSTTPSPSIVSPSANPGGALAPAPKTTPYLKVPGVNQTLTQPLGLYYGSQPATSTLPIPPAPRGQTQTIVKLGTQKVGINFNKTTGKFESIANPTYQTIINGITVDYNVTYNAKTGQVTGTPVSYTFADGQTTASLTPTQYQLLLTQGFTQAQITALTKDQVTSIYENISPTTGKITITPTGQTINIAGQNVQLSFSDTGQFQGFSQQTVKQTTNGLTTTYNLSYDTTTGQVNATPIQEQISVFGQTITVNFNDQGVFENFSQSLVGNTENGITTTYQLGYKLVRSDATGGPVTTPEITTTPTAYIFADSQATARDIPADMLLEVANQGFSINQINELLQTGAQAFTESINQSTGSLSIQPINTPEPPTTVANPNPLPTITSSTTTSPQITTATSTVTAGGGGGVGKVTGGITPPITASPSTPQLTVVPSLALVTNPLPAGDTPTTTTVLGQQINLYFNSQGAFDGFSTNTLTTQYGDGTSTTYRLVYNPVTQSVSGVPVSEVIQIEGQSVGLNFSNGGQFLGFTNASDKPITTITQTSNGKTTEYGLVYNSGSGQVNAYPNTYDANAPATITLGGQTFTGVGRGAQALAYAQQNGLTQTEYNQYSSFLDLANPTGEVTINFTQPVITDLTTGQNYINEPTGYTPVATGLNIPSLSTIEVPYGKNTVPTSPISVTETGTTVTTGGLTPKSGVVVKPIIPPTSTQQVATVNLSPNKALPYNEQVVYNTLNTDVNGGWSFANGQNTLTFNNYLYTYTSTINPQGQISTTGVFNPNATIPVGFYTQITEPNGSIITIQNDSGASTTLANAPSTISVNPYTETVGPNGQVFENPSGQTINVPVGLFGTTPTSITPNSNVNLKSSGIRSPTPLQGTDSTATNTELNTITPKITINSLVDGTINTVVSDIKTTVNSVLNLTLNANPLTPTAAQEAIIHQETTSPIEGTLLNVATEVENILPQAVAISNQLMRVLNVIDANNITPTGTTINSNPSPVQSALTSPTLLQKYFPDLTANAISDVQQYVARVDSYIQSNHNIVEDFIASIPSSFETAVYTGNVSNDPTQVVISSLIVAAYLTPELTIGAPLDAVNSAIANAVTNDLISTTAAGTLRLASLELANNIFALSVSNLYNVMTKGTALTTQQDLQTVAISSSIPFAIEGANFVLSNLGYVGNYAYASATGNATPQYTVGSSIGSSLGLRSNIDPLVNVVDSLPDDEDILKNVITAPRNQAPNGITPTIDDLNGLDSAGLKSYILSNPENYGGLLQEFTTATIPKSTILNTLSEGYNSGTLTETDINSILDARNIDYTDLTEAQKYQKVVDYVNANPAPELQLLKGFTLGNAFNYQIEDIVGALQSTSTDPQGALIVHISDTPNIYNQIQSTGGFNIEPTESRFGNNAGSPLSNQGLFNSVPVATGLNTNTTLGYTFYGSIDDEGTLKPPSPNDVNYKSPDYTASPDNNINRYYGNVQATRFPQDYYTPDQFANDYADSRVLDYPTRTQAAFYSLHAAELGDNIIGGKTFELTGSEYETQSPVFGSQKEISNPFDIYTIRENQGLFKDVPVLEDLFPSLVKGTFTNTVPIPVTQQDIYDRMVNSKLTSQEMSSVPFESFSKSITPGTEDTGAPLDRYVSRVSVQSSDGGFWLVQENSGLWNLIGGGRDLTTGESSIEAAISETQQEIGLNLNKDDLKLAVEGYAGKDNIFFNTGLPFRDITDLYTYTTDDPLKIVDTKEISNIIKYTPGNPLDLPLAPDARALLTQLGVDVNTDIPQVSLKAGDSVALDLDGTLIDDYGTIRPYAQDLINYLKDNNIDVGIFTHSTAERAYEMLAKAGLEPEQFSNIVTREDYTESDQAGVFKPIKDFGFNLLIDNDPNQVAMQHAQGNQAITLSTYEGGDSYALYRLKNELDGLIGEADTQPSVIQVSNEPSPQPNSSSANTSSNTNYNQGTTNPNPSYASAGSSTNLNTTSLEDLASGGSYTQQSYTPITTTYGSKSGVYSQSNTVPSSSNQLIPTNSENSGIPSETSSNKTIPNTTENSIIPSENNLNVQSEELTTPIPTEENPNITSTENNPITPSYLNPPPISYTPNYPPTYTPSYTPNEPSYPPTYTPSYTPNEPSYPPTYTPPPITPVTAPSVPNTPPKKKKKPRKLKKYKLPKSPKEYHPSVSAVSLPQLFSTEKQKRELSPNILGAETQPILTPQEIAEFNRTGKVKVKNNKYYA